MATLPKRPRSPEPDDYRRVRQRTKERSESPEEGEVEDVAEAESVPKRGITPPIDKPATDSVKTETVPKGKVAFPFKTKASLVKTLPKADLINGSSLPKIPLSPPREPTQKGDSYRPPGSSNNNDRDKNFGSSRDKGQRYDRRGRNPTGDSWVNQAFANDDRGSRRSTYSDRGFGGSPRRHSPYGSHYNSSRDDYRRPSSPYGSRYDSRQDDYRSSYDRSPRGRRYDSRSPPREHHNLPPRREVSPPRHSRYDDYTANKSRGSGNSSRDHSSPRRELRLIDRIGPQSSRPRTPSPVGPPPQVRDQEHTNNLSRQASSPSFGSRGERPFHGLPNKPAFESLENTPQKPEGPPRQPANYTRRIPPGAPAEKVDKPHETVAPNATKSGTHKIAQIRSRKEEKMVYGREFIGSGRLGEYIIGTKLGEGTFGYVAHSSFSHTD